MDCLGFCVETGDTRNYCQVLVLCPKIHRFYLKGWVVTGVTDMKHYRTQQGVELTQYKLIKHFYTHLNTSNLRPERAKLTIRVQQTSNEFKSFHWNGTSVEIFLQLMENVFGIIRNSEFVDWFFFTPWIKYCWCYRDGIWLNSGLRPGVSLTSATYDGTHLGWVRNGPQDRDFTSILRTAIQLRPQFVILKVFFYGSV